MALRVATALGGAGAAPVLAVGGDGGGARGRWGWRGCRTATRARGRSVGS